MSLASSKKRVATCSQGSGSGVGELWLMGQTQLGSVVTVVRFCLCLDDSRFLNLLNLSDLESGNAIRRNQ